MPKKTLNVVKKTKNQAVVQVKDNQKFLNQNCQATAQSTKPIDYCTSRVKGRNRRETRTVEVFNTLRYFDKKTKTVWQKLIKAIIKVKRTRKVFDTRLKAWQKSIEVSFYVSTTLLSAREFSNIIREHWWIENKNHYVRDVNLSEDRSRIRINPDRMVVLRSMALNLMRANQVKNISQELFLNAMSLEKVLTYDKLL